MTRNKTSWLLALICVAFFSVDLAAQTTATIGTGTSSSSTTGPFQRSDTASSTVYSRFVHIYTASELAAAGITNGVSITQVNWEIASSNVIIGSGNANLKIYVKNSTATAATADTWSNLTAGSSLVFDQDFNTTNNFPGANGWMPFVFSSGFTYTGGALEIAVDWDCSQVSSPAFSGDGAIKWRWQSTAPDFLVVKKTSSSSPSSNISDLKDQRANIQMVYSAGACNQPGSLGAMAGSTTADLSWGAATNSTSYNWKVVAQGAGSTAAALDSGNTAGLTASASGLTAFTAYDFFVEADCGTTGSSGYAGPFTFLTQPTSPDTITIGMGTSSSSTRGPFQRSDTTSSTVFSRFVHIYTATELAAAGITSGADLTQINWEIASSNVIIGTGDATLKVYLKNSTATAATADQWTNLISGSTLVHDQVYNVNNNFLGANGWMPFGFNQAFTYTGGALEVAVDWDCSQVSAPRFSGDGAIKWNWESTAPDFLVVKKTSSSSPSSNISDLKDERANIQMVYTTSVASCDAPGYLSVAALDSTSADLSWSTVPSAASYNWIVVNSGAGSGGAPVANGTSSSSLATASGLMAQTSYDYFVQSDCGTAGTSGYSGPFSFVTIPSSADTITIGTGSSSSSTRGPFQRSDTASSTVYSRFVHVYTAAELLAAGIPSGASITQLNWEIASSNVIIGTGNAELKVYIKNSTATLATPDTWSNKIAGADLVFDRQFNSANNFPGLNGWMRFGFNAPFVYTGGALEIAVDWDCSQVSSPAFSGDGALKWRWESTAPDSLVVKKTSSSSPSSDISDQKDERANIQMVYTFNAPPPPCDLPTGLSSANADTSSADLSWTASTNATGYNWKVVAAGGGSSAPAIDSGTTNSTSASTSGLSPGTSYDFFVEADCGVSGTSGFQGPETFSTTDNIGIVEGTEIKMLSVFPNPTQKDATIEIQLERAQDVRISVYSIFGLVVEDLVIENTSSIEKTIDISRFPSGTYLVRIETETGMATKRLVKSH